MWILIRIQIPDPKGSNLFAASGSESKGPEYNFYVKNLNTGFGSGSAFLETLDQDPHFKCGSGSRTYNSR